MITWGQSVRIGSGYWWFFGGFFFSVFCGF